MAAALRDMARSLMITWARATTRSPVQRSSDGMYRFTEAQLLDYTSRILENCAKERRVARAAGVGLAGVAALILAGFGIHRLNRTTGTDQ